MSSARYLCIWLSDASHKKTSSSNFFCFPNRHKYEYEAELDLENIPSRFADVCFAQVPRCWVESSIAGKEDGESYVLSLLNESEKCD